MLELKLNEEPLIMFLFAGTKQQTNGNLLTMELITRILVLVEQPSQTQRLHLLKMDHYGLNQIQHKLLFITIHHGLKLVQQQWALQSPLLHLTHLSAVRFGSTLILVVLMFITALPGWKLVLLQ